MNLYIVDTVEELKVLGAIVNTVEALKVLDAVACNS